MNTAFKLEAIQNYVNYYIAYPPEYLSNPTSFQIEFEIDFPFFCSRDHTTAWTKKFLLKIWKVIMTTIM